MLAATKRWFRRNRTPLAIGAGVIGAGYVVTNYVLGKLQDARERMSSDRIAKENLRRRFEQNQEDCTFTVLALLPTATTNILEAMNTEKITYEIQQMKGSAVARAKSIGSTSPPSLSAETDDDGRSMFSVSVTSEAGAQPTQIAVPTSLAAAISGEGSAPVEGTQEADAVTTPQKPKKTKRQLWNDLTISSITRAYTLLYTLSLLTMLTRIQLNLLGRRSYLSSVVSLATGSAQQTISLENNDDDGNHEHYYGSDFEVNRRYLTFSWWLLNRGWVDVMQRVETAVRQVFGHLSPRDTVTIENFLQLTSNVRTLVEGSSPASGVGTAWLRFLLPPEKLEDFVLRESGILDDDSPSPTSDEGSVTPTSVQLRRLLDETADLIDSPTFSNVLTQILDAGFDTLKGQLAKDVVGVTTITEDMSGFTSRAVLLPKILSVLTRQAHDIGNGMPNRYLQAMEQVRDLEGFAAVVYSSNWQAEIAQDEELELLQQQQQRGNSAVTTGGESVSSSNGPVREDARSPGLEGSTVVGGGDESIIVVGQDPQGSFEGAWERAMTTEEQR
ncbi:putative PEX3 peroxisomal biogenesis factor 3 [Triangularia setosa]|uniref:PEX3 peroxisomal biogenesis factor 3 n=1 Tax=Triangularia setosa TaxID=2587417 RepID=A0AAN6W8A7_9PEZI|nr:putative PEX3 peroxisomal biogenesis factor 3 [Podospora setosa]